MRLFEITKKDDKVLLTLVAENASCCVLTYDNMNEALTIARRFLTNPGTDLNIDPYGSAFSWACNTGWKRKF